MQTPDDLFRGERAAVLLFLTKSRNDGHWIAVLNHPGIYEVFDSFGTHIDGDRTWLDREKRLELGEVAPLLSNLLSAGSKPVTHNTKKLQSDSADTCGYWAVDRIRQANTPLTEYVKQYTTDLKGGVSPDMLVVKNVLDRG